jgi:hypothetical protein
VHSCGQTGAPARRPARCSDRPRQHIAPRRSRSARTYGSVVGRLAARRRNQNRTAIPAVPIEAPTSIPTPKYWETTASKAGHAARAPRAARPASAVPRRARRFAARSVGPICSATWVAWARRREGLLRLLAAARARTRTASAFVPLQDTPRPYADPPQRLCPMP